MVFLHPALISFINLPEYRLRAARRIIIFDFNALALDSADLFFDLFQKFGTILDIIVFRLHQGFFQKSVFQTLRQNIFRLIVIGISQYLKKQRMKGSKSNRKSPAARDLLKPLPHLDGCGFGKCHD